MKKFLENAVEAIIVVSGIVLACAFVVASLYALGFFIALV